MINPDCVHLTDKGVNVVRMALQKCVHFYRTLPAASKPTLGASILCRTKFSNWVDQYAIGSTNIGRYVVLKF